MGKKFKAHSSPLWVIEKGPNNTFFTGGSDGLVIQWNAQFAQAKTIDIKKLVTWQPEAGLRSIDLKQDGSLLVGTRGSDVLEVTPQGQLSNIVVQGHYKGVPHLYEVWGCASHPTEQVFASSGGDKTIRLWHETKMIKVSKEFEHDITALDWSRCGNYIAAGDRNA
jgi:WD40 repeat protein